jgi:hypothetical protein
MGKAHEVSMSDEGRSFLESIPTTLFEMTCKLQINCETRIDNDYMH